MNQEIILTNSHGVHVIEAQPHCRIVGAVCCCGEELLVAPAIYKANHQKDDPVVVCMDHGVHSYRFLDLVAGKQPKHEG